MEKNTIPQMEVVNIGVVPQGADFATVEVFPNEVQILFEDGDQHVNFSIRDARRIAEFILANTEAG